MKREAIQTVLLIEPLPAKFFSRYANHSLSLKDSKTVRTGKIILKGPGCPSMASESDDQDELFESKKVSRIPMQTQVGDIVYYLNKDDLMEIEENNMIFHVISESHILYFDRK